MSWLRYGISEAWTLFLIILVTIYPEVNNMNTSNEGNFARHDILEVNNYLMEGLAASPVDNWFTGPIPQFRLSDLGIPYYERGSLVQSLAHAHQVAADHSQMAWQKVFYSLLELTLFIDRKPCRLARRKISVIWIGT